MTDTVTDDLYVGRPPGTSPGWVVWHRASGLQAIMPVRYRANAAQALAELLATGIDWSRLRPITSGSRDLELARPIYVKYGALRQKQLADNRYWPRPKEC